MVPYVGQTAKGAYFVVELLLVYVALLVWEIIFRGNAFLNSKQN
jgi:hypothetical protein